MPRETRPDHPGFSREEIREEWFEETETDKPAQQNRTLPELEGPGDHGKRAGKKDRWEKDYDYEGTQPDTE